MDRPTVTAAPTSMTPGMGFPNSLIGVMRYCRHIVREKHSPLPRGPFEY